MKYILLIVLPFLLAASPVRTYDATVLDVHDGDTITVQISLGLDVSKKEVIRLLGVDCPELKTKEGKEVAAYARKLLTGKKITIQTNNDDREKYGRLLATVIIQNINFNELLISKGFAKSYAGGAR